MKFLFAMPQMCFQSPTDTFEEEPLRNTLFPKSPKEPRQAEPIPLATDPETQEARDEQRRKNKKRRGRDKSVLTSEQGVEDEPTVEKKSLLGGQAATTGA